MAEMGTEPDPESESKFGGEPDSESIFMTLPISAPLCSLTFN